MAAGSEPNANHGAYPTLPQSRQRRTASLAGRVLTAWLDVITRLAPHIDMSEHEEALPVDPLLSPS